MGGKSKKLLIKKWQLRIEKWGECIVKFFVKEDKKFYYGTLIVPPKKRCSIDDGHPRSLSENRK
mgnify:CR=1 FL=1